MAYTSPLIRVIVKGDRYQAAACMAARGVPFVFHKELRSQWHSETVGFVCAGWRDVIQQMFHEEDRDEKGALTVGSVLLWNTDHIADAAGGDNRIWQEG